MAELNRINLNDLECKNKQTVSDKNLFVKRARKTS